MSKEEFINKLKNTGLKQREIADILGVSEATVSMLFSGKQKPTRQHVRIIELYFGKRKKYENPKIEAVARIMEELDPAAQEDILRIAEKEKRLQSIEFDVEEKKAA